MRIFKRISFQIVLFCVLGSILRLVYGVLYTPWELAPDQIAWEIIIRNGEFSYSNLIYYPHEGGSFLISLQTMVLCFNKFCVGHVNSCFGVYLC